MKNTLFIFFIAIASTTTPSYAKKFVVKNKMKIPTWIGFHMRPKSETKHGKIIAGKEIDHTIMKEFKLQSGYSHIIKYTGEQHCLEKLYLRYHKGANWWLLSQSPSSVITTDEEERACSNREFIVKGKIDKPYFISAPYPEKINVTRMKAKTIHVGSSFQTIKDTIKKIVSSSLFKKETNC